MMKQTNKENPLQEIKPCTKHQTEACLQLSNRKNWDRFITGTYPGELEIPGETSKIK